MTLYRESNQKQTKMIRGIFILASYITEGRELDFQ